MSNIEAQHSPSKVNIAVRRRDDDLTAAFNCNTALHLPSPLISSLGVPAVEGRPANWTAILIGNEINKSSCCYVLGGTMMFSFVIGVVVALLFRRIDLALGAVAAVAAWVACFESLFWWLYH